MATYKVLQDIEAEDTLIGPLTLRQCIYAAVAIVAAYLSFMAFAKHAAFLIVFLLPFIAFGAFFAFPWSKQQSTEVWALAKVRFYFKPRTRIWNQSGVKELVTITAPKTIQKVYRSNLSPVEVESRLKALADTSDSRGWAVKNVDLGYYSQSLSAARGSQTSRSDRLVQGTGTSQDTVSYDTSSEPDMFDVENNPVAQKFDMMISQSNDTHRQQIMQQMAGQDPSSAVAQTIHAEPVNADYWHLPNVAPPIPYTPSDPSQTTVSATPAAPAFALTNPLQYSLSLPTPLYATPAVQPDSANANPANIDYSNIRIPATNAAAPTVNPATIISSTAVTERPNSAILELANNNDLNVATIAREAKARTPSPGQKTK